uniref:SAP domain-containing protein n=1 Tax=Heterosigma akashiwo TaxID=2829 RepID=A0A7S3Y266_HETAK
MFVKDGNGQTPFSTALRFAWELQGLKIVSEEKVGVTLFGTTNKGPGEDFLQDNVYELQSLDIPSAQNIKELERLGNPDLDPALERFGAPTSNNDECPLRGAIFACTQSFNLKVKQAHHLKRLWVLTNDDLPCGPDAAGADNAVQAAKDGAGVGVDIRLFSLDPPDGSEFDITKFWDRVLTRDPEDFNEPPAQALSQAQEGLLGQVRRKLFKKRKQGTVSFVVCEGDEASDLPAIKFEVQVYNMFYPAKKPSSIWLDSRTNKPLKPQVRLLDAALGAALDDLDYRTYLDFGGARAYLDRGEKKACGAAGGGGAGFTLLGFKPIKSIGVDQNLKSPYFIYPSEDTVQGSTSAFVALLDSMLDKKVCAICHYIRVQNSPPQIVALLPQREELDGDAQFLPPGMHVVFLPFADDVRDIKVEAPPPRASAEAAAAAARVVSSLDMGEDGFVLGAQGNPALQRFYAALQAVALGEADLGWSEEQDGTAHRIPEEVLALIRPALEGFRAAVPELGEPGGGGGGKRKATSGSAAKSPAAKKTKAADEGGVPSDQEVQDAISSGQIQKWKVADLKDFLGAKKQSKAGKKQDLIDRISSLF